MVVSRRLTLLPLQRGATPTFSALNPQSNNRRFPSQSQEFEPLNDIEVKCDLKIFDMHSRLLPSYDTGHHMRRASSQPVGQIEDSCVPSPCKGFEVEMESFDRTILENSLQRDHQLATAKARQEVSIVPVQLGQDKKKKAKPVAKTAASDRPRRIIKLTKKGSCNAAEVINTQNKVAKKQKRRRRQPKTLEQKSALLVTSTHSELPSDNLLLRLPGELRNKIYEYALIENRPLSIIGPRSPQQPGITRTCRLFRHESIRVFYTRNTFQCTIYNFDPTNFKLYRKIADTHGLATVLLTHSRMGHPTQDILRGNFLKWLIGTYEGTTAPLGYSAGATEETFQHDKLSHRIVKAFNIAVAMRKSKFPHDQAEEVLKQTVALAGVCGEYRR